MSRSVYEQLLTRLGEQSPQPRLAATQRLVDLLGNPERSAPAIHLTGTNGKTSTARMIDSLLRSTGLRTGLLTSPHLVRFAERIQIDGDPVTDETIDRVWSEIAPVVELVDQELTADGELPLTFFEALTGLAFAVFADAPVDVMVIEVGMGGEWDATNVVHGTVCVFTPIDLDHLGRIGNSLEEIAETKAGILKAGSVSVSARQTPAVVEVLRSRARALDVPLRVAPEDFGLVQHRTAVGGQLLDLRGLRGERNDVFLPLYGAHQADNAALALAAVEAFLGDGTLALSDDILVDGFGSVTSPGRLEPIGAQPTVLVDGAHNPHGMRALVAALNESFQFDELRIVFGALEDKDFVGLLRAVAELPGHMVFSQSRSDRALAATELGERAAAIGLHGSVSPDLSTALREARDWAGQQPGRGVLVTGSLTVVGEARELALSEGWLV